MEQADVEWGGGGGGGREERGELVLGACVLARVHEGDEARKVCGGPVDGVVALGEQLGGERGGGLVPALLEEVEQVVVGRLSVLGVVRGVRSRALFASALESDQMKRERGIR